MTPTIEQVMTAALELPDGDRVEALTDSLDPADRPPIDESWRPIARRRSAVLNSGEVASIPWAEVERLAREAAGGLSLRL